MTERPDAVAFDVVETLFSLESLRPRLADAGLPPQALETWFAQILRDAFALDTAGIYKPFREVAGSALASLLGADDAGRIDPVLDGFAELEAEADVAPAMRTLSSAGVPIVALTNGSAEVTRALLERAAVAPLVQNVISIDEIGHWKPRAEVYRHCADTLGVAPGRLALVAAHGWDLQGARRAGLATAFIGRRGALYPPAMEPPDMTGETLIQIADRLAGRA